MKIIMKSTIRFIVALLLIVVTEQNVLGSATHIIKVRSAMNTTAAHSFLLSNHNNYVLSQNELMKRYLSKSVTTSQAFLDSFTIDNNFTAITGVFLDESFIDYLYHQESVEYVEINQIYKAQTLRPLQDYQFIDNTKSNYYEQLQKQSRNKKRGTFKFATAPNWGQARIMQHERVQSNQYVYDESAGEGIHVYVLDTGVNVAHTDFEGRAIADANFVTIENELDLGGHGTHVASKIAGKLYGVAKKAQIHSVKVLDKTGDGTTSSLVKGISHVIQVAKPGKSIINLSLSGPRSRLIDDIISKAVIEHNIPVFVSAGNTATDACYFSPSSNSDVFTVGASDLGDEIPYYSNSGECVRLYAPGSDIESAWIGESNDRSKILDGTSMANPHVAGIAAALLSKKAYANSQDLYNDLVQSATINALSFKWSTVTSNNNVLAFMEH